MFNEHMLVFLPPKIGISYKVKEPNRHPVDSLPTFFQIFRLSLAEAVFFVYSAIVAL